MTIGLGKPFQKAPPDYGPLAELVAGLRSDITAAVRADILSHVAAIVTDAVSKIQPPTVNVPPAQLSVAAPAVTVTPTFSPQITVEGEDDAGEIEEMARQTAILKTISSQLERLIVIAGTPMTRRVIRDANQQIIEVTESRA